MDEYVVKCGMVLDLWGLQGTTVRVIKNKHNLYETKSHILISIIMSRTIILLRQHQKIQGF